MIPNFLTDEELVYWVIHKSNFPFFQIFLPDCPYSTMLKEAMDIKELFVSHRDDDNSQKEYAHKGWKSICIHGESYDRTESYGEYPDNNGKSEKDITYKWCSEVVDRCPETFRYFKEVFPQQDYRRLRFMWLDPHGYIQPHIDYPFSMLGPINISLNNPEGCEFEMKNVGTLPFKNEGSAFMMNLSYEHKVTNNSDTPRIHIISHGKPNKNFNKIILDSIKRYLT